MKVFTAAEARVIREIVALVTEYPETVRICLAARDSLVTPATQDAE